MHASICRLVPSPKTAGARLAPFTWRLALAGALGGAFGCSTKPAAHSPGVDLGATGVSWAAKNREQKFGFMAAQVHPLMMEVFLEYDEGYEGFGCGDCHGTDMELIDYKMPQEGLYALPSEGAYDDALEFDEEIAAFMIAKVTPVLQRLYDMGEGPRQQATCFSCHPVAE